MVIAPARKARDPGSNPGPDDNFSSKLYIYIYIYTCTQVKYKQVVFGHIFIILRVVKEIFLISLCFLKQKVPGTQ